MLGIKDCNSLRKDGEWVFGHVTCWRKPWHWQRSVRWLDVAEKHSVISAHNLGLWDEMWGVSAICTCVWCRLRMWVGKVQQEPLNPHTALRCPSGVLRPVSHLCPRSPHHSRPTGCSLTLPDSQLSRNEIGRVDKGYEERVNSLFGSLLCGPGLVGIIGIYYLPGLRDFWRREPSTPFVEILSSISTKRMTDRPKGL